MKNNARFCNSHGKDTYSQWLFQAEHMLSKALSTLISNTGCTASSVRGAAVDVTLCKHEVAGSDLIILTANSDLIILKKLASIRKAASMLFYHVFHMYLDNTGFESISTVFIHHIPQVRHTLPILFSLLTI